MSESTVSGGCDFSASPWGLWLMSLGAKVYKAAVCADRDRLDGDEGVWTESEGGYTVVSTSPTAPAHSDW